MEIRDDGTCERMDKGMTCLDCFTGHLGCMVAEKFETARIRLRRKKMDEAEQRKVQE